MATMALRRERPDAGALPTKVGEPDEDILILVNEANRAIGTGGQLLGRGLAAEHLGQCKALHGAVWRHANDFALNGFDEPQCTVGTQSQTARQTVLGLVRKLLTLTAIQGHKTKAAAGVLQEPESLLAGLDGQA